jgi:cell division protein FtsZ
MASKGMAIMGTGMAKGDNRAVEAASQAISSPLLENISIEGATGIIINVTGGPDLTLWEVNEASTLVTEAAHEDAEVIFGAVINPDMSDEIRVTVIATGFQQQPDAVVADQIHRMQAMAQAQLDSFNQADVYRAFIQQQAQQLQPQTFQQPTQQRPEPRVEAPRYEQRSEDLMLRARAATPSPAPLEYATPAAPAMTQSNLPIENASPTPLSPMTSQSPTPSTDAKALPRELLIQKAKAFREQQNAQVKTDAEQLSMSLPDENELRRNEGAKSPFSADSLDVPAFLRRQLDGDRAP